MHGGVIQGRFQGGLPRVLSLPAHLPPPPARPSAFAPPAQPRMAPRSGPPPGSGAPAVQRLANGTAVQLPAQAASFGNGPGQRLPAVVQQKMEAFFKASFADVRVHVGPQAAAIGAIAFTHGSNLFFAPGQYDPASPRGQQLLGHELAHVVQQRSGRVRNPFGSGLAVVQDQALEAEAERLGLQAARFQMPAPVQAKLAATAAFPRPFVPSPLRTTVQRMNNDLPNSLDYSSIGKNESPEDIQEAVNNLKKKGKLKKKGYTGHLSGNPGDGVSGTTMTTNSEIAQEIKVVKKEKKVKKKEKLLVEKESGFGNRGCPQAKNHAKLKKKGITHCGVCNAEL